MPTFRKKKKKKKKTLQNFKLHNMECMLAFRASQFFLFFKYYSQVTSVFLVSNCSELVELLLGLAFLFIHANLVNFGFI